MDSLINTGNLVQKFLPKQADIDKIFKVIQRKVLKGTHLPVAIKEIQAGYLISPYFKDIYLYLATISCLALRLQFKSRSISRKIHIIDSLLFIIETTQEKETALSAILEVCADEIIAIYYSSLSAGHQGDIKTYLTINDKFFIPNLIHYLCSYIKGCHISQ